MNAPRFTTGVAAARDSAPQPPRRREPVREDGKGRWVLASYRGECSGCWGPFSSGSRIRADGDGGWEAGCCDDD